MTMNKYVDMMKQGMVKYLRQWTKGDWVAKVPPQRVVIIIQKILHLLQHLKQLSIGILRV